MLDIKFVRENPEIVKENIKKKFQDQKLPLVDEVIELDEKVRALKLEGDTLRNEKNNVSNYNLLQDYISKFNELKNNSTPPKTGVE